MKIYLDYSFLEDFLLNNNDPEVEFRLKSLLSSPSNENTLIVNFDPIDFFNDPEKAVIARHISSRLDLNVELNFEKMPLEEKAHSLEPHTLFLVNREHSDFEEFGFPCYKSEELDRLLYLLNIDEVSIEKEMKDWAFLERFKTPCNAMVITDNYLLSNDIDLENTKSILKVLLPKSLKFPFDLTIIGYDAKKSFKPLQTQYKEIEKFLKDTFRNYEINLTIIREDYHERAIYTNCTRFKTHKGFSIFRNKTPSLKDKTIVHYSPIASKTLSGTTFKSFKEELSGISKKVRIQRMADRELGSKSNRLFG